ncbi:unnamed protein product [Sphenostylis stenocarpa]|uniref:Uncharacterized protein n=1 Tax=Sphenostylis stenocarpa TaxID=92480 RepID=A0AA86W6S8_9FABA|nr:unnamed protein product [Sphenostylis stenocarpa]
MGGRKWSILVAIFILLIAMEAAIAQGQGGGNGSGKGNDNEKGKGQGQGNDNGKGKGQGNDNGKGKGQGQGNDNGKGKGQGNDKGKGKGQDKNGKQKGKDTKPKHQRHEASDYDTLPTLPSGQERGFCRANTTCEYKAIVCPPECTERKPKKNKKQKACFINCSSKKCEATCKGKFQGTSNFL